MPRCDGSNPAGLVSPYPARSIESNRTPARDKVSSEKARGSRRDPGGREPADDLAVRGPAQHPPDAAPADGFKYALFLDEVHR